MWQKILLYKLGIVSIEHSMVIWNFFFSFFLISSFSSLTPTSIFIMHNNGLNEWKNKRKKRAKIKAHYNNNGEHIQWKPKERERESEKVENKSGKHQQPNNKICIARIKLLTPNAPVHHDCRFFLDSFHSIKKKIETHTLQCIKKRGFKKEFLFLLPFWNFTLKRLHKIKLKADAQTAAHKCARRVICWRQEKIKRKLNELLKKLKPLKKYALPAISKSAGICRTALC